MASCGGICSSGVLSGTDGAGDGDFGGVVGGTMSSENSEVEKWVEDIVIWKEY